MQRKNTQQVQRDAIRDCLQKRSARAVGMVAQAFVQNEPRKDQRLRPNKERNRRETQICKHHESEGLELAQSPLLSKHQPSKMKQREWHEKLRREQRPCLGLE